MLGAGRMLGLGEPVLWRKRWNGAVMTALPMRAISDSPERTVLYLAPDTRFKGARTQAGNKVRDFSDWVSKDLVLDLVVAPDRSWRLKDEEDFRRAVADGYLTAGTESRVRAEAERVISVVAAGGRPFCESEWLDWRPPTGWTVAELPEGWAR